MLEYLEQFNCVQTIVILVCKQITIGWLFYGISTLFGSFNANLNFKQYSLT